MNKVRAFLSMSVILLATSCAEKKRDKDVQSSNEKSVATAAKLEAVAAVLRKPMLARDIRGKNVDEVIILDGSRNEGDVHWKQTAGPDLKIPDGSLKQKKLGLEIYQDGDFEFSLTVSKDDGHTATTSVRFSVKRKDAEPGDRGR